MTIASKLFDLTIGTTKAVGTGMSSLGVRGSLTLGGAAYGFTTSDYSGTRRLEDAFKGGLTTYGATRLLPKTPGFLWRQKGNIAKLGFNTTKIGANIGSLAIKYPKTTVGLGLGTAYMASSATEGPTDYSPAITGTTIAPINYNQEAIRNQETMTNLPQTGYSTALQQVPYTIQPKFDQRVYGMLKDSTNNLAQSLWVSRHG